MDFISCAQIDKFEFPQKNYIVSSLDMFARYYEDYFGDNFESLDFFIRINGQIIGYVICAVWNQKLTLPNDGIIITLFDEELHNNKKIISDIVACLFDLAQKRNCSTLCIRDNLRSEGLSTLSNILCTQRYQSKLSFEMAVDLTNFSEDEYRKTIRKSYRSLINWGKRNLHITRINKSEGTEELMALFQAFHQKISKKKTRSDTSWSLQYNMAKSGLGEATLAYLKNELVAASFFADYGCSTTYFTGVYERNLFKHGISHYLLYDGIYRSFIRGNTRSFNLGYFETNLIDKKLYDIQFFKKGFCEQLRPVVFWTGETIG